MARIDIPFFIVKPGRGGDRYFWQPSTALRALGWRPERLAPDLAQAIERARELNRQLESWRAGNAPTGANPAAGPRPGTMADLIHRYKQSARYRAKAAATRKGYDWCLNAILAWTSKVPADLDGLAPIASITAPKVQRWYEEMHATKPGTANAVLRVMRLLFTFARRNGDVTVNPAAAPGLITPAKSGRIWTDAEVDLLVATADAMGQPSIGDAIELAFWLGQRPTDIRQLRWDQYKAGVIAVTQSKTAARVTIPESPRLLARLEAARLRQQEAKVASTTMVVCESTKRPYTEYHFSHTFAEIRARAVKKAPSLAGLQFKHLRHTAVTRLAEAGCTIAEIARITGHSLKTAETILEHYLVRTDDMAAAAVAKRLAHKRETA